MNNRSFEDLERSLEEILFLPYVVPLNYGLCTLCLLALMSFLIVFLFLVRCFLCILTVY